MSLFDDLRMYARFARKLPSYLSHKDTPERGREVLAERLARRGENFLDVVERAVYAHPGSPYLPLLRAAGCEAGDLRKLVGERGVEGALEALRDAGVRVRFEQFKGHEPLVVAGRELPGGAALFVNPLSRKHLETMSSGSTGARTRNPIDLDHKAARAAVSPAIREAQGILGLPRARVGGMLPESSGFGGALSGGRGGTVAERWFTPVLSPPRRTELRFRVAHHFVVAVARLYGVRVPKPEPLPVAEVIRVARWAAETIARRGACVVHATPSMCLRIALAAREAGLDLTGLTFTAGGEPLTSAKAAAVTATGARIFANYNMSEVGAIGVFCTQPVAVNEQHVMIDQLALVQAPRQVGDVEVDALLVTSLLPTAPKVLLNVETDDFGVLEQRRCGCPLDALGLHTHVRDVRSFKKLTAEGMTLVGSEMEQVLEQVLPERFGGSALDYQLAEEEDAQGFTRLALRVSPSVGPLDERAVLATVLAALEKASISADLAIRLWNHTGAIRVVRAAPVVGARGKQQPLLLVRRATTRNERSTA
ncbi:MAG: hypothetical protein NDJ75_06205 [Thermoanaerobaculia bacterium]|nr:hypothetical protein [Thermoanaerobaculia bacterium]